MNTLYYFLTLSSTVVKKLLKNRVQCCLNSLSGWAWYPPLELCDESHLSIEFSTRKPDGVLLYNGPIVPPETDEQLISDFISLELVRAHPRLLVDFGSGTLELRVETKNGLDDGDWHRIDIFWDREEVRMVVDFCKSAVVMEHEDGTPTEFDDSSCQVDLEC